MCHVRSRAASRAESDRTSQPHTNQLVCGCVPRVWSWDTSETNLHWFNHSQQIRRRRKSKYQCQEFRVPSCPRTLTTERNITNTDKICSGGTARALCYNFIIWKVPSCNSTECVAFPVQTQSHHPWKQIMVGLYPKSWNLKSKLINLNPKPQNSGRSFFRGYFLTETQSPHPKSRISDSSSSNPEPSNPSTAEESAGGGTGFCKLSPTSPHSKTEPRL